MTSRHASTHLRSAHLRSRWLTGWVALLACAACAQAAETQETVFTYRGAESALDTRYLYQADALRLALEKTRKTHGAYRLEPSPAMITPRAVVALQKNQFPNFFVEISYDEGHMASGELSFIPFPVDRGIVGYRVCFASEETKGRLARAQSLEDLRSFKMGLGSGWADAKIFRHNGFQVVEGPNYEGLFQMLTLKRFDLFCRGANEIREEWEAHRNIPGLDYDQSISIAYPLPRFFFVNKANAQASARVEKGLMLAYQDGSLQALWRKYFRNSLEFVKLKERRIFWLENPLVKGLDFNYRKYFYDPLNDNERDTPETKSPNKKAR